MLVVGHRSLKAASADKYMPDNPLQFTGLQPRAAWTGTHQALGGVCPDLGS